MSTAIGPTVVVSGIPATIGPFTPAVGTVTHLLTFDVGAWAGTVLTLTIERSEDSGSQFSTWGGFEYTGPVSAWVHNLTGSIAPSITDRDRPATATTRLRYQLTADGAFASTGGTYTAS